MDRLASYFFTLLLFTSCALVLTYTDYPSAFAIIVTVVSLLHRHHHPHHQIIIHHHLLNRRFVALCCFLRLETLTVSCAVVLSCCRAVVLSCCRAVVLLLSLISIIFSTTLFIDNIMQSNTFQLSLECPICLSKFVSPVVLPCCGKSFCRGCLSSLPNKMCITCNKELPPEIQWVSNRSLEQLCEAAVVAAAEPGPTLETKSSFASEEEAECVICRETTPEGIRCSGSTVHITCSDCFPYYVISAIENPVRLQHDNLLIRCPLHNAAGLNCDSGDWDYSMIANALFSCEDKKLGKSALDRYMHTLHAAAMRKESVKGGASAMAGEVLKQEEVLNAITEALNLRCPSNRCNALLDPDPEGEGVS
jgi:hypothetical protein